MKKEEIDFFCNMRRVEKIVFNLISKHQSEGKKRVCNAKVVRGY